MPDGRMLSKSIATSEQVASVSLLADYLFTRMIPHLDCDGRMAGSPRVVRGIVCPLREDVTAAKVSVALNELHAIGLIVWYTVGGHQYIEFPKFRDHQRGARFEREGASRIPPAPSEESRACSTLTDGWSRDMREDSGSGPGVLPLSEVKVSEVKSSQGKPPTDAADSDFARTFAKYPRRAGGNSRKDALRAWQARLAAGVSPAEIEAGVERYAAFIAATGKEGTEYVKQAATFFGPSEHWTEPWDAPADAKPRTVMVIKDGWFEDVAV